MGYTQCNQYVNSVLNALGYNTGDRTAANIYTYLVDQGYEIIKPSTEIKSSADAHNFFADLKPGDIVFHRWKNGQIHHVAFVDEDGGVKGEFGANFPHPGNSYSHYPSFASVTTIFQACDLPTAHSEDDENSGIMLLGSGDGCNADYLYAIRVATDKIYRPFKLIKQNECIGL